MNQIKLWKVGSDSVTKISKERLDYENRLERWLTDDISILSDNLAVIGTQVFTPYGKKIDILGMNSMGELVIIELKRDKTYREVIAQSLDYATWVKDIDIEGLNDILRKYGKSEYREIEEFYSVNFNKDPEEIEFNSDHKILIVGSEIDDSTVRIVNYLSSEPYSVNINAVNFNYFKDENGNEFLAQSFIILEDTLTEESRSKKRKRSQSIIKKLFEQQKLKIGDKVYFKPALDAGYQQTDPRIFAEIVNTDNSCLRRLNEKETYSFSSLRKIISKELNLNVKYNWGFGMQVDWINNDGKSLNDLLDG